MLFALMIIFHVLGFLSSIEAIMKTRTSQGSIAWGISLNTFPYIAVPAYWIFGRSRFQGYDASRSHLVKNITELNKQVEKEIHKYKLPARDASPSLKAAEGLADLPALNNNKVELLIDGEITFSSIFEGIDNAKKYILVQFYIVHDDGLGRALKERLIKKAKQGLKVYFLYDEVGSKNLPKSYITELKNSGVYVNEFNTRKGSRNIFQVNFRNHRKNVIVDGKISWIGGHNVGDEYLGKGKMGAWRDTHVRIEGPAALEAQLSFIQDWQWATDQIISLSWEPHTVARENAKVIIIPTGPADSMETASLMFLGAINSAQEKIWIASPYFVPDDSIINALQLAGLRGVDVRILIPQNPDSMLVYYAAYSYFSLTSKTGAKIYKYKPGFLHEKVVLIDDRTSIVGTANFDNRSFRLNFEISAIISDTEFQKSVNNMFLEDFKKSRLITLKEETDQTDWFKFKVRFANLFAAVL